MTAAEAATEQMRRAHALALVHDPHPHAADRFGLALVGHEVVEAFERAATSTAVPAPDSGCSGCRARARTRSCSRPSRAESRTAARCSRRCSSTGRGFVDVRRQQPIVGALDDDDAVLAVRIRRRSARRRSTRRRRSGRARRRCPGVSKFSIVAGPKRSLAHAADHGDIGAAQSRRDRLVGALAAPAEVEVFAEDRLPGLREAIGKGRQIDVRAADDGNLRSGGHRSLVSR